MAKQGNEGGFGWVKALLGGSALGAAAMAGVPAAEAQTNGPLVAHQEAEATASADPSERRLQYLRERPYKGTAAEAVDMFAGANHPDWFDAQMVAQARTIVSGAPNFDSDPRIRIDETHIDPTEHFALMTEGPVGGGSGPNRLVNQGGPVHLDLVDTVLRNETGHDDPHLDNRLRASRWVVRSQADSSKIAVFTHLEICNNMAVNFLEVAAPQPRAEVPPEECVPITIDGFGDRGFFVVEMTPASEVHAPQIHESVCWPDVPPASIICIGEECAPGPTAFEQFNALRTRYGIGDNVQINTEIHAGVSVGASARLQFPKAPEGEQVFVYVCPPTTPEEERNGVRPVGFLLPPNVPGAGVHLNREDWRYIETRHPVNRDHSPRYVHFDKRPFPGNDR